MEMLDVSISNSMSNTERKVLYLKEPEIASSYNIRVVSTSKMICVSLNVHHRSI